MAQTKTTLSIDGKRTSNFTYIELTQEIGVHHQFKIVLDHDTVEPYGGFTIDRSRKWLGAPVVISFGENDFVGVITNVSLKHKHGHNGDLILTGQSPTIALEDGTHLQSWTDKNLSTIAKELIESAGLETSVRPQYKDAILFETQYNETHFGCLQRLAADYQEWFYYDGIKLCFGGPASYESLKLEYGSDLLEIDLGITTRSHGSNQLNYNPEMHESLESPSKGNMEGQNELGDHAFVQSKRFFKGRYKSISPSYVTDKGKLDKLTERSQARSGANLHTLKASSKNSGVKLCGYIQMSSAKYSGKKEFEKKHYGEYLVAKVTHYAEGNEVYHNEFEALPGGITVLPTPKISPRTAQNQEAEVIDNADPQNMGRVQVKFQWQSGVMASNWLRVMAPDAGSSDHHGQNRGHVFVPEIGDQVMVGFQYNDPNRPFVMGGMFHGQNGAGGSTDNTIKSIITRSGHVIAFDDTKKAESITITDKSQNKIFIDTAKESITISAPKNITLASTNIYLNGDEIELNGKNIKVNGSEKVQTDAPTVGINGTTEIIATSPAVKIEGKETNIAGDNIITNSTADTLISGGMVKINS